jgi:hypothetical protein
MIRKTFLTLAAMAFASTATFAAPVGPNGAIVSKDKRMTTATSPSHQTIPYKLKIQPGLSAIVDNLAEVYPDGTYFCCSGWTISGAASPIGEEIELAVAFTPATAVAAKEVALGVGYVTGTNGIVASINEDSGGLPGGELASFRGTGLPTFGSCCVLVTADKRKGAALDAGEQYWLVVRTNKSESDEWAAWNLNDTEQVTPPTAAQNTGSGWQSTLLLPGPAFAIYGK